MALAGDLDVQLRIAWIAGTPALAAGGSIADESA